MSATTEDQTYEGWKNYETWAANLWLANDEGLYLETLEKARFAANQADPVNGLAYSLKYWVEDLLPDLGATLAADLLNAAFSEIDWREIAQSWIESMNEHEPCVCGGTGYHDNQPVDYCDECKPGAENE